MGAARLTHLGLLVAADGAGVGSLWALWSGVLPAEGELVGAFSLGGRAQVAWELARRVARERTPFLGDENAFWSRPVVHVRAVPPVAPWTLAPDGESFGLAFVLAEIGRWLGEPVPEDIVASAALGVAGELLRVGGQRGKAAVLAGRTVRLLVHREDEAAWRDAGASPIPVDSVDHAVALVWPDIQVRVRLRPGRRDRSQSLFELAVQSLPGLPSGALGATADLMRPDAEDDEERWWLDIASAIAHRHVGDPRLVEVPEAARQAVRPELWRGLLAHVVQSVTDLTEAGGDAHPAIGLASAAVTDTPAGLKLAGALGRYRAAWGERNAARVLLSQAVEGWLELGQPLGASHALCELLRVEAVWGTPEDLDALVPTFQRVWHPSNAEQRSFLALAFGRARVSHGDAVRALAWLTDGCAAWEGAFGHVRASRLRWLAVATRDVGRDVQPVLAALEAHVRLAPADLEFLLLSRLDDALAAGADPAPFVDALRAAPGPAETPDLCARMVAQVAHWRGFEDASAVALGWRY